MSSSLILESLCELIVDCKNRTPPEACLGDEFGYAIGTPDIRNGRIVVDNAKLVDKDTFGIWTARAVPTENDIVLTREAPVGRVGRVEAGMKICLGQRTMLLRPDISIVDPRFLQYLLLESRVQNLLHARASGSTVPHLRLAQVRELPMPSVPSLPVQRAIGDILGALDDKITVNERIVRTARSLGTALFDGSCAAGSQAIPIGAISSSVIRGGTPTYTQNPNELVVVNQKCIRDGRVDLDPARRTLAAKVRPDRLLRKGDVLVNSTGVGTLGRVAIWAAETAATCDSHVTIVRPDAASVPAIVCGYAILSAQSEIELLGEGSTGQTELSRHKLAQLKVSVPIPDSRAGLTERLGALELRCETALAENRVLGGMRSTLLGPLICGQLRIKDAEKLVSDAP